MKVSGLTSEKTRLDICGNDFVQQFRHFADKIS